MLLLRVIHQFNKYKSPYALVGGHAVALQGAVRGTVDVDFITTLSKKNLSLIEKALFELNLTSRLPITPSDLIEFKDEYIKNKNLIAWNFININNPTEQIDIIITTDLKEKKIDKIKIKQMTLNVLSKEDLIKMKKKAGRKQDLADVEALEKLNEK